MLVAFTASPDIEWQSGKLPVLFFSESVLWLNKWSEAALWPSHGAALAFSIHSFRFDDFYKLYVFFQYQLLNS